MNDPNAAAINTPKILSQVEHLKRLRAAPGKTLPMGWADGEVPPTAANAMSKAGLARIEVVEKNLLTGKTTYRVVAI